MQPFNNLAPATSEAPRKDRYEIHSRSIGDPNFRRLRQILVSWTNSILKVDQVGLKQPEKDCSDGHLLALLFKHLADADITVFPSSAEKMKHKNLRLLVAYLDSNQIMPYRPDRWSVEGIVNEDHVSIYALLVDAAHIFGCPYVLPSNVTLRVQHTTAEGQVEMIDKELTGDESVYAERIAGSLQQLNLTDSAQGSQWSLGGTTNEKAGTQQTPVDAFDQLLQQEGSEEVTSTLNQFVNRHLAPLGYRVQNLISDMHDGSLLILLIGKLANFFVPLKRFHLQPSSADDKRRNIEVAIQLLKLIGVKTTPWNPERFIRQDQSMVLRALNDISQAFQHLDAAAS